MREDFGEGHNTVGMPVISPVSAITVVFVVHAVVFASWTAHIPQVKAQLALSDGALGTALLGAPVGSVVALAASSWLLPRVGSHRMVRVTVAGYGLCGVGVGLANSLATLFSALLVWGFFQGALDVAMNTQAVAVEHARGAPLVSRLHGVWSLGEFAGALLGTAAVAAGIGLTAQLPVLGLVAAVLVELLSVTLIADERAEPASSASVASGSGGTARLLSRTVVVLGVVAFASVLCEGAAADWSATYLRTGLRTDASVAGLGFATFAVAMVGVRLAGPALQVRLAPRTLLPLLASLFAVGMSVALASAQPIVALLGFACMGAGVGLVVPMVVSAAGNLGGGVHSSTAVVIVSGAGWIGGLSGPPLIGEIADWVGLNAALWLLPASAVAIAAITRFAKAFRGGVVESSAVPGRR